MSDTGLRAAIAAIYRQVDAPDWAAANLDGLADVLRDLSWLPPGPVVLAVPDLATLSPHDRRRLRDVLHHVTAHTAASARPVRAELGPAPR